MQLFLAIIGVILVAYGYCVGSMAHFNANAIIPIFLGIPLLVQFILRYFDTIAHSVVYKWIKMIFIGGYCLYLIAFCICTVLMFTYPKDTADTQAAIVLGAGLRNDQPSKTLALRLDRALAYAEQNPQSYVVVSGGLGATEVITEAQAMKSYLTQKGLDEARVLMETNAQSTAENIRFSKQLLDEKLQEPYKVAIISSDYHVFRALLTAKQEGVDAVGIGSQSLWYLLPAYLMRETVVIMRDVLFGSESFAKLSSWL